MSQLACETLGNIQGVNAGFAFAAAAFWLLASLMKIPNSQDHFIAALQNQSRINALAALCAAVAAALQAFLIVQPTCINL